MKEYLAADMIGDGCTVGIFRATDRQPTAPHTHDFIEIVYTLAGEAEHRVGDDVYTVRRGDLLFLNYGSRHAFTPHSTYTYANICFAPEKIASQVIAPENAFALLSLTAFNEIRREADGGKITFSARQLPGVESLLSRMLDETRERRTGYRRVLDNCLNILFTEILRRTLPGEEKPADDFDELVRYIDENPGEHLTLASLARKCFYNPSYFSRTFRERMGIPLTEYLLRRRIEYAKTLLRTTNLPAEEIAVQAGFGTRSAFYRAFSKQTGVTPGQFRQSR